MLSPSLPRTLIEFLWLCQKEARRALKSHAESTRESVNAFVNRAILGVAEMDNMHKAY